MSQRTRRPDVRKRPAVELRGVVLVFRHGARAPSANALKWLAGVAEEDWESDEVEQLTPTGLSQMETLGKHVASTLCKEVPSVASQLVSEHGWLSSPVRRVVDSGRHFWKGFAAEVGQPDCVREPAPPANSSAEELFRSWAVNKRYLTVSEGLRKGDAFKEHAQLHQEFLESMRDKLKLDANTALYKLLDVTTYVHEMAEVEKYDEKRRNSVHTSLGHDPTDEMSKLDLEKVQGLAKWCWSQRFFHPLPEIRDAIGGALRQDISERLQAAYRGGGPLFTAYSAHDYSILALLSDLNVPEYPGQIPLGFASYLVFRMYSPSDGADKDEPTTIEVSLNTMPFLTSPTPHIGSQTLIEGASSIEQWTFDLADLARPRLSTHS